MVDVATITATKAPSRSSGRGFLRVVVHGEDVDAAASTALIRPHARVSVCRRSLLRRFPSFFAQSNRFRERFHAGRAERPVELFARGSFARRAFAVDPPHVPSSDLPLRVYPPRMAACALYGDDTSVDLLDGGVQARPEPSQFLDAHGVPPVPAVLSAPYRKAGEMGSRRPRLTSQTLSSIVRGPHRRLVFLASPQVFIRGNCENPGHGAGRP